jgi:hypothetical protein
MKRIYGFFEIIFFRINSIVLNGQSEENNAHFASMILSVFLFINIITIFLFINRIIEIQFNLFNQYIIIAIFLFLYLLTYLLFIRKNRYKTIKERYLGCSKTQIKRMKFITAVYLVLSFILFLIMVII